MNEKNMLPLVMALAAGNGGSSSDSQIMIELTGESGVLSDEQFANVIDNSKNVVLKNNGEIYRLIENKDDVVYIVFMNLNTQIQSAVNFNAIYINKNEEAVNYKSWSLEEIQINIPTPIIISVENNTTINGYQVPALTPDNIQTIYNGIIAGNEVLVSDATDKMHFKVNQADSISDEIFISFLYFDIMILQYDESGNITYKEFATKSDIYDAMEDEY